MARELVEKNGIGDNVDAIWRALNTEHQKLFPATPDSVKEDSGQPAALLPTTRRDANGLVEDAIGGDRVLIFGQRPGTLSGTRRRGRKVVAEQGALFNLN
jgi:hypothetical protein